MAITVACDLSIYAADLTSEYPLFELSDLVELRVRSRYQLLIKSDNKNNNGGHQIFPIDDVFTPEFRTFFAIPSPFLFSELSELYVEKMLQSLELFDDPACKFLAPKITEFAADLAERRGAGEVDQGYATVAEVGIVKVDFIEKEELVEFVEGNLKGSEICNVEESDFFTGKSDFMAEIDNSFALSFY